MQKYILWIRKNRKNETENLTKKNVIVKIYNRKNN